MTTRQELVKLLESAYTPDCELAVAIWQADDVMGRAEERKMKISREQANEIISRMHRRQNANLGITWITIDCYLDELESAQNDTC